MKNICKISIIIIALLASVLSLKAEEGRLKHYKNRYKVNCVNEKITDNFGNGNEELYGTRNVRTILYGIAYRGGANNFYHRNNKRDNHNPLPDDGLQNLADEGFSTSVYLYATNFSTAKKEYTSGDGKNKLEYLQIAGNSDKEMRNILYRVYQIISDTSLGPIYLHCWNGWHQSGYVSSAILKQFCGYSDEQALQYWIENTDGVTKGYDNVKKKVVDFKPYKDLFIPIERQKEICPCMNEKNNNK